MTRRPVLLALCGVLLVGGCSLPSVQDLPLPGGAAGDDTYTVDVIVDDAAALVPKSGVRVDDVAVGDVESISLTKDLKAKIVCVVDTSVHLPRNATATIESTSLLGENFVALGSPSGVRPVGRLGNGDTIRQGTSTLPDTEQVLAALSAVLNGGSLGQAGVIVRELTAALHNRTGDVRDLLSRLDTLVGSLDRNRGTVVAALDGLDRLSGTLARQHGDLGAALAQLPAGIKILADERPALTRLLSAVARLGDTATRVIRASRANLATNLALVGPVLAQLQKRGTEIADSLNYALTFPFGKDALAAFKGDYAGFYASLDLNVDDLGKLVSAAPTGTSTGSGSSGGTGGSGSTGTGGGGLLDNPPSAPGPGDPVNKLGGLLLGVLG